MFNFLKNPATLLVGLFVCHSAASAGDLTLWYDKPARTWMTEALPVGNGTMGAMIFGGVDKERIQFNHEALWTGNEKDTGHYQNFGDLIIDFAGAKDSGKEDPSGLFGASAYRRELNIDSSIYRTMYQKNGISYGRELFASHPDQVIAFRLSANKAGAYTGTAKLVCAHGSKVEVSDGLLKFAGALRNGMKFEARVKVINDGGTMRITPDGLEFDKVNSLTFFLVGGTNYLPDQKKQWRGEDPGPALERTLSALGGKTYTALREAHTKDYQKFFRRFSLDLGESDASRGALPTDARLLAYTKEKKVDTDLEELFVQYGRYLMISSSRPGDLPANLQGLWNDSNTPPWRSDYHSNINIQMNYWPTEPTNLGEMQRPLVDYLLSQIPVYRERTKEEYGKKGPIRGWTVRTENGIHGGGSFLWNPPGSAWYAQHVWEHYAYSQDKEYLAKIAYPFLKEVCEFWEDLLIRKPDGTLTTPVGWSPEHGPQEEGIFYDIQLVYDLFTNYMDASVALGADAEYRAKIATMRDQLVKPKIGKWGQLQEWQEDRDNPKDQHRHVSHLFALHPGRQITPATPELFEAAKVSLKARGDGGTGWSRAWKINFWARFQDGDHSYLMLRNLMTYVNTVGTEMSNGGGVYPNLFDAHPPFQIDGNFGATAGVAEMLVQSHTGEIQILPALPSSWPTGNVKGIRTRGGFELDLAWKDSKLIKLIVRNVNGTTAKLRYGAKTAGITVPKGGSAILDGNLQK